MQHVFENLSVGEGFNDPDRFRRRPIPYRPDKKR